MGYMEFQTGDLVCLLPDPDLEELFDDSGCLLGIPRSRYADLEKCCPIRVARFSSAGNLTFNTTGDDLLDALIWPKTAFVLAEGNDEIPAPDDLFSSLLF